MLGAVNLFGCGSGAKKPLPKTGEAPPARLDMVRNQARDIFKEVGDGNWVAAIKAEELLKTDWRDARGKLAKNIPAGEISKVNNNVNLLGTHIKGKKKKQALETANSITSQLADIKGNYKNKVPAELDKLGYYIRETMLGAEFNDMKKAKNNYQLAAAEWKKVKPQVSKTASGEINFQDGIDSLKMAVNNKQKNNIINFGNKCLAALDKIAIDFKK